MAALLRGRCAAVMMVVLAALGPCVWASCAWAQAAEATPLPSADSSSPDAAFASTMAWARAEAAKGCRPDEPDRLVRIVCAGTLRVGVRGNYRLFGFEEAGTRSGYEIDIARELARRMGVEVRFVGVTPANRIALLGENQIDLTIATMGHTTLRDGQARFIRPHYYASSTALVGPRDLHVPDFAALGGRSVCVTVGNASNSEISLHGGRLLLFDSPAQLVDRLRAEACSLIAQDDSFLASAFLDPVFAISYDTKFLFDQLPWGMAVARDGSGRLAVTLGMLSQIFHRDGVFLDLARRNHIGTGFLEAQQRVWAGAECNEPAANSDPGCVAPPLSTDLAPTPFAASVTGVEDWLGAKLGIHPTLAMFKIAPAWDLVRNGLINSVMLIGGTLAATLLFALLFSVCLGFGGIALRLPVRGVIMLLQSSPVVLTLVIAAAIANAMFTFSATAAMIASMLALGLTNGSYAGQAIAEAMAVLRAEALQQGVSTAPGGASLLQLALRRSIVQIMAFLINATKGTPVASFVGAPELLNALTDSTSFSADRATTYWLLLIFYTLAVLVVVRLCMVLRHVLERRIARS